MGVLDFFGYNFPFMTPDTVLAPQSGLRIIKNDLKQLLLTSPGERVMRPNYGTGIRQFTFEQLTDESIDNIRDEIRRAVFIFEKRVRLTDVLINSVPDRNLIEITVLATLSTDPNIELSVDVQFPTNLPELPDQRVVV